MKKIYTTVASWINVIFIFTYLFWVSHRHGIINTFSVKVILDPEWMETKGETKVQMETKWDETSFFGLSDLLLMWPLVKVKSFSEEEEKEEESKSDLSKNIGFFRSLQNGNHAIQMIHFFCWLPLSFHLYITEHQRSAP